MGYEPITSRRNPLVKALRELHHPAGRLNQQCLLLEGTHLLQEALRLGRIPNLLLATTPWMARHGDLLSSLPPSTMSREASAGVLEAVATTRHPDGVVCTLPFPLPTPSPTPGAPSFGLLLDHIQDPGNLGTLLRTALAAGVDQIWLVEGADPWQPKVLRASSGASLALAIGRFTGAEAPALLQQAKQAGTRLLGTVVQGGVPYWEEDWGAPVLLMLGNEGSGLGKELLVLADALLTIPLSPGVESLNVAVAAAPLLLERRRQLLGAGTFQQHSGS